MYIHTCTQQTPNSQSQSSLYPCLLRHRRCCGGDIIPQLLIFITPASVYQAERSYVVVVSLSFTVLLFLQTENVNNVISFININCSYSLTMEFGLDRRQQKIILISLVSFVVENMQKKETPQPL
ncbi:unnamed protein product [Ceratitis capitata]|uniref:(Mediterranean fruit fly) hypothetical protein n=1 Tax=Ceratitis capitata TaxID=7213 RepID=A0A811V549_CERCA|nr:unnamed protein product [Ceratitis capitata]